MDCNDFICECGKRFDSANSLRSHGGHCRMYISRKRKSKYIIEDGKYECECGRVFCNSQSLMGHFSHCSDHLDISDEELDKREKERCKKNKYNYANLDKETIKEYNKKSRETIIRKIKEGNIQPSFLGKHHTDETKEKIRRSRVSVLSDGLVHSGFDKSRLTYIERWFINEVILKKQLNCKFDIVNEMRIYPYFLDFAFSDIKLDVELDGEYHNTDERKEKDKQRENKLSKLGWKTYRITARDIKMNPDKVVCDFMSFINKMKPNKKLGCLVYRLNNEHILEPERYTA